MINYGPLPKIKPTDYCAICGPPVARGSRTYQLCSECLSNRLAAIETAAQAVVAQYADEGDYGTPLPVQMLAKALKGENA